MPLSVSPRRARRGPLAVALFAIAGLVIPGAVLAAKPVAPTTIQILNVSDWHANLDPLNNVGGAWNISARWKVDDDSYPTLKLTAGDDFGAAPPLSGFFDEAPSIQAQRLMGIQVNTFGNHNFDKGVDHLQSMIDLAAAPTTGSHGAHPGQPFRYVATNLSNMAANLSGVDRIAYFTVGGVKVAILGIVNEDAPSLVSPGNFGTMLPTDGVVAAQKGALEARKAGAQVVIVITHKGMASTTPPTGTLLDFASALPGGLVDVVIGDHTNVQYRGTAANGVLFHENYSFGASYAKTLISVRPGNGPGVVSKSVDFVTPGPAGTLGADGPTRPDRLCTGFLPDGTTPATATWCDQDILDMLDPYRTELAALLDGTIGTTTKPFDRGNNIERRHEVPLGDLIADGMRETYGTDIAFFTGGGIRSQFPSCGYKPVDAQLERKNWNSDHSTFFTCPGYADNGGPYDLVIGDVYSVITFGNNILTRNVTGAQLWKTLENGVSKCPLNYDPNSNSVNCAGRFPQVSGFKFTFDKSRPSGCSGNEDAGLGAITWACTADAAQYRVTNVALTDGTPIPNDPSYTLSMAVVDFTNNGGDSYWMLADGQGTTRDRDANVMLNYMNVIGPDLNPDVMFPGGRITICPCP